LQTSYIDLYQVHWPDPLVPVEKTAETLALLYRQGKIRALGMSNYSPLPEDDFERWDNNQTQNYRVVLE